MTSMQIICLYFFIPIMPVIASSSGAPLPSPAISAQSPSSQHWWRFSQSFHSSSSSSSQSLWPLKRNWRRRSAHVGCIVRAAASDADSAPSTTSSVQTDNVSVNGKGNATLDGNLSYAVRTVEWPPVTGGALDFKGATDPLSARPLAYGKRVMLVRHGSSFWNEEGRIQGSSDSSLLSEQGILQAKRCREALSKLKFDKCYASPISRAKTSAEVIWSGREDPLIFLDNLREANLQFLEGMKNEDAKQQFPELYKAWREDPANFNVDGVYPVVELWARAKKAWDEILTASGERVLVVTHKSILRALICSALGLKPDRFRSIDIHNSGISSFTVNKRGEPMLESLNMTAHLHADGVFY